MLSLRDIRFGFGRRDILSSIDLTLEAGTLTVLLGPNGAGKSTLLKVMTGELQATGGSVTLLGQRLDAIPPARLARQRAVLPQSSVLAFPFTVREVVALGRISRGGETAHDRARHLDDVLERVGLAGFGGRLIQDLSGGEQQRVHLARVLCQAGAPVEEGEPRALFLDEPTASLDIRHQIAVLKIARQFADAGGMVFAILHDLNLGTAFADRYLVLDSGRMALAGTPCEVLQSPRLADVFGLALEVHHRAGDGAPIVMPAASPIESRMTSGWIESDGAHTSGPANRSR